MGLVMWHSDTKSLLGVLRGEVTLTWQKHRTEIDLKGSSCPVTSKRQGTALSPWRAKNGYVPSFSHFCQSSGSQIEKMSFQFKFLFNFGLLVFHPGDELVVSISLITNFPNLNDSVTINLFISSPPSTMIWVHRVLHLGPILCRVLICIVCSFSTIFSNMWLW